MRAEQKIREKTKGSHEKIHIEGSIAAKMEKIHQKKKRRRQSNLSPRKGTHTRLRTRSVKGLSYGKTTRKASRQRSQHEIKETLLRKNDRGES